MIQSQQAAAVVGEVVIDKDVKEEVTRVNSVHFLPHQSINYVNISNIYKLQQQQYYLHQSNQQHQQNIQHQQHEQCG